MKSVVPMAVLAAMTLFVAGCGSGSTSSSQSASAGASASPRSSSATSSATKVSIGSSKLGKMLVDGSSRTLYLFLKDKGTASTCSGPCANVWPPLVTQGKPQAGPGASARQLGTTNRADGRVQVTYHGHPLYFYAADHAPGDTAGQRLKQFGAEWYVLSPDGVKLEKNGS